MMKVLRFQVSDRLVEVSVEGSLLTRAELEVLQSYLAIQLQVAATREASLPAIAQEAGPSR